MNTTEGISLGNFVFYNNFDSANLARVEQLQPSNNLNNGCDNETKTSKNADDTVEYEFNLWTNHDCQGTEYQNNNRTWFYFGVNANVCGVYVKFNVINLNKQVKMFSQGMCPVYKVVPGHPQWERIKDKPTYSVNRSNKVDEKGIEFNLSFTYCTPDNVKAVTYFAFTYPFTYTDLQNYLCKIDNRMSKRIISCLDDIYYHRECAIKSLENRRLDLLTISSYHNISSEREMRIQDMFPEESEERPFKFRNKKVIFISARVHPGETPSSFVINGFINFLLNREDPVAITLRRLYVFKFLPMLNPDGVARGHYRMDTKGVNLNRVYLNPSKTEHPTIFAARNLIKYHHHCYELPDENDLNNEVTRVNLRLTEEKNMPDSNLLVNAMRETNILLKQVTLMSLDEKDKMETNIDHSEKSIGKILNVTDNQEKEQKKKNVLNEDCHKKTFTAIGLGHIPADSENTGLFLYIDLHGHASKKGIFMYGNYFDDSEDSITCMLLPKLMSINNTNFHFSSCNFAERNMYLIDKRDGMSREGSGRVAVYRLTGLIRSYTLECNYNSGRLVNTIPPRVKDGPTKPINHVFVPPKYTPSIFEEVGAALGPSILDLTNTNPNSRLQNSQYRSLRGVKSYLRLTYVNNFTASLNKRLQKDNTQETISTEPPVLKVDPIPLEHVKDSMNAGNVAKKSCIVRRTTSMYTAIKKIKSNKKSRQISSRKIVKGTAGNDAEINPSVLSKVVSTPIRSKKSKIIQCHLDPKSKPAKKILLPGRKQAGNLEETTVIKQGSKRLKVVSPKTRKARPEVGDGANVENVVIKSKSKVIVLFNKQKAKSNFGKARTKSHRVEQTKLQKSSRIKSKSQSLITVGNHANDISNEHIHN